MNVDVNKENVISYLNETNGDFSDPKILPSDSKILISCVVNDLFIKDLKVLFKDEDFINGDSLFGNYTNVERFLFEIVQESKTINGSYDEDTFNKYGVVMANAINKSKVVKQNWINSKLV